MCGILGVASGSTLPNFENFSSILDMMSHRGPDASGEYYSNCNKVILGHKRLSIVELSKLGSQPMFNDNESISLVFNGEIYNHNELREELISLGFTFRGRSDTEVIIKSYECWGDNCIRRFNGPFAFVLYDKDQEKIIFARDRSGEKPLFFREFNNIVYFSSDLVALTKLCKDRKRLSVNALTSYLSVGYPLGGSTLVEGCLSLEPGSFATLNLKDSNLSFNRYWVVNPVAMESNCSTKEELVNELEFLLSDAVRLQLNCDVPACILLSGGVDSSLLTAFSSQHTNKVKTFTVTFPGHPAFDETDSARLIAKTFDTEHTELEGVDVSPELFLDLANSIDSPVNDSSLIPTFLVYKAVSKHCKVALGGDGADELFGGYKHYSRLLKLNSYLKHSLPFLRKVQAEKLKKLVPKHYRIRNWFEIFAHDLEYSIPNIREIFNSDSVFSLLQEIPSFSASNNVVETSWLLNSSGHGSIIKNCCVSDFQTYLRESILVKSDRCSMLNSVEARTPFLDTRVIDFAFEKVPDSLKTSSVNRKIILKNISEKLLPDSFDFQRKLGFNLPLESMIRKGKWKQLIGDVIHSDCNFLSLSYRAKLFGEHLSGKNNTDKLFGIVLLMIWAKRNNIGLR